MAKPKPTYNSAFLASCKAYYELSNAELADVLQKNPVSEDMDITQEQYDRISVMHPIQAMVALVNLGNDDSLDESWKNG